MNIQHLRPAPTSLSATTPAVTPAVTSASTPATTPGPRSATAPGCQRVVQRASQRAAATAALAALAALLPGPVAAQNTPMAVIPPAVVAQAVQLATAAAAALAPPGARVQAQAGALDPRLALAPCADVQAYLPAGVPPWGRTRVGLRCNGGPVRWNVYLPVTVEVWGQALVSSVALPAGARLADSQLQLANVDLANGTSPTFTDADALAGRSLARPLAAGQAVRGVDLQQRKWFASGDSVTVVAGGSGFAISTLGEAMAPGIEGQAVRVKLENGRQVSGRAVGERRVEVEL